VQSLGVPRVSRSSHESAGGSAHEVHVRIVVRVPVNEAVGSDDSRRGTRSAVAGAASSARPGGIGPRSRARAAPGSVVDEVDRLALVGRSGGDRTHKTQAEDIGQPCAPRSHPADHGRTAGSLVGQFGRDRHRSSCPWMSGGAPLDHGE
jgi:hypothetical protein